MPHKKIIDLVSDGEEASCQSVINLASSSADERCESTIEESTEIDDGTQPVFFSSNTTPFDSDAGQVGGVQAGCWILLGLFHWFQCIRPRILDEVMLRNHIFLHLRFTVVFVCSFNIGRNHYLLWPLFRCQV